MAGSAVLAWPLDLAERVAMRIALCRAMVAGKEHPAGFARQFYYTGSSVIADYVRAFAQADRQGARRRPGRSPEGAERCTRAILRPDRLKPERAFLGDYVIIAASLVGPYVTEAMRRIAACHSRVEPLESEDSHPRQSPGSCLRLERTRHPTPAPNSLDSALESGRLS
jgi:hypothetical protein